MKKTLLTLASLCVLIIAFCFSASAVENYTFNTVEGGTTSIYSEKYELTINIFGRPTCLNTSATISKILLDNLDELPNIKFNFIDIDSNTRETVAAFKSNIVKELGENNISFCYCEDKTASALTWKYLDPNSYSMTLPCIAYIDKEGNLIKYSTGLQDAESILKIINYKDSLKETASFSVSGTENYNYAFEVLEKLNELRASKGLSALTMDEELLDTAMQRAAEISVYYSHTRPDGRSCFTAFPTNGALGENIAIGQKTPTEVMEDWTNSEGHYNNMINSSFRSVGIGAFEASDGTLCWVQFFYGGERSGTTRGGIKETTRQITATLENLNIKLFSEGTYAPYYLEKGKSIKAEIANTNYEYFYAKQKVSASDFTLKSENENLLVIDENGLITVKGDTPFDIKIKIISKSNPKVCFDVALTVGHEHSFYVLNEEKTYTYEEEKIKYTYKCSWCDFTYNEDKVSKHEHLFNTSYSDTTYKCVSKGKYTYTCYLCNYSYTEEIITGSHDFSYTQIVPATKTTNGSLTVLCNDCWEVKETSLIPKIDKITISKTKYTYNGKEINPIVTVKNSKGTTLKEGTDYYIYSADNLTSSGIKEISVYFEGKYDGYHTFKVYIHPASPTGLTLKSTAKTVTAKWKKAKGAASYKVELLKNGKIYKTEITSDTSVKFEKLSKNTKYSVRVISLSAFDSLSSLKGTSAETATVSAPALKVKAQKKKASLSWEKVKRADGYVIYMATSKNGKYEKIATVKSGTLKYTKKKLKSNKKYYFKIKAYRTIGKKKIYSSYSSVKSVKVK